MTTRPTFANLSSATFTPKSLWRLCVLVPLLSLAAGGCVMATDIDPDLDADFEENVAEHEDAVVAGQGLASLEAHWSFDNCPNGTVPDLSGHNYKAVLAYGATCASGGYGYFDGLDSAATVQPQFHRSAHRDGLDQADHTGPWQHADHHWQMVHNGR